MKVEKLSQRNIFLIPIGEYFGQRKEAYHIVYAPFVNKMLIADEKGLNELDTIIDELTVTGDIRQFFSKVEKVEDLQKMSILPNHTCNFNCAYCYSAKGRSNTVLDKGTLKKALEYFINPKRLRERNISISFIGGGEPLLSWTLVKYGIEYAYDLSCKHCFNLLMTVITNGSIMNDDIIETFKHYNVLPDISFDIIEDAQNKNRKHFDIVCQTLRKLCDNDIIPSINATITPDTVNRMEEMLTFTELHFPKINNMVFEPVVSDAIFPTAHQLRLFYDIYLENFFKTKNIARLNGKNVTCRIYKNLDSLLERGCPSKFTLTPQGDISICYCTSSPKEKMFSERTYGKIDGNGVYFNNDKFRQIHNTNVYSLNKCKDCYAKWHCGGGCMCPNDLYDNSHLDEVCRFTRQMLKHRLLERLEDVCIKEHGMALRDYCLSK